jgi:hypothetical protein
MAGSTKLDRFISSFRHEAELRVAILGLLEKLPNTTNVRLTHGSQEHGKDIVFHSTGAFEQRQLVACVVKNDKITGSADKDQGARAVYTQAEQALDTPVANVADGREERVAQVFIISPHECPPATVDSIKGKLQKQPGVVLFLCGRELMETFEKHYPEFLIFQSTVYGSYVAEIEAGLDCDPAVTNVLFRYGFVVGSKALTAHYVRPKFSRELHHHYSKFSLLDYQVLLGAMTLRDAQAIQKSLQDIGLLIAAMTMPDETGLSLGQEFKELSFAVKRAWQESYMAHALRQDISSDDRKKHVAAIHLADSRTLHLRSAELVSRAREIIRTFEETLRSANQRVATKAGQDGNSLIESKSMLDYCQIESVARQVPSLLVAAPNQEQTIQLDENFIESSKADVLISGPAGFGKTSFCKWQTINDVKRLRTNESDIIPIFIPLHQHAHGELATFETTFLKVPEFIALWRERSRRFRLYLDGLDEVPSIKRQQQLLELALSGKQHDPTLSLIVTAREHVVGTHLRQFVRIQVCEFDQDQIAQLAAKWFDDDRHATTEFFTQLAKVPSLMPLMSVPLLATLILGVYRSTKTLPESRVRLYDMFVGLLAGGWDSAKGIHRETRFGPAPKLTVLTKLAAILHINCRRDCDQLDFKNAVALTLPGLNNEWQRLLEETLQDGLLISVGVNYAFAHMSFQEFLAAKDLFEPNGRKASRAFRDYLSGEDWWREVTLFYIALSSDPKDLEHFIKSCAHQVLSKGAAPQSVANRLHFLLEGLMTCFRGAQPNFEVPSSPNHLILPH